MSKNIQSFKIEKINRKSINESSYNPRKVSKTVRDKLKKQIKENGLVMPLVINKQTGNTLVSGHLRLSILDEIYKTNDYELDVAVIDISLEQEIKLNIVLNNTSLMGEWDFDKLSNLFNDYDALEDFGFDKYDLDIWGLDFEKKESKKTTSKKLQETKDNYRKNEINNALKEGDSDYGEQNDYILTIVFNTNIDKQNFCTKLKIDRKEKYIKYSKIFDIIKDEYKI